MCGATSGDRYLEKKYPEDQSWTAFYEGTKPIIYGHHVVGDNPKIQNNTYGIDTGACHGNYLTAIELPGFEIHQVKSNKDYWKEEQKKWQIPVLKAKNWADMPFVEIDKQLEKLAYIEDIEIKNYLAELKNWKENLENSYVLIKDFIDNFTKNLLEIHKENFSIEANKHSFKSYIFKSKSDNLTIENLQKALNTPNKLLNINNILLNTF